MSLAPSKEDFLEDIESIFQSALAQGQYQAALKAKEILGREKGFFKNSKKHDFSLKDNVIDLEALSDEELQKLINQLLSLKSSHSHI